MRIGFMGTPDFAVPTLDALIQAGHDVVCVYSQPPRPAGRGHKLVKSPVHLAAETAGIQVRTPERLRGDDEIAAFQDLRLDIAVVVAYGLILPRRILEAPRLGCINVHASLLPRWRGAAPIQRAILAGDAETGVTIMQMARGLDTGDMLLMGKVAIDTATTTIVLHDHLAAMGAALTVDVLTALDAGSITPVPQSDQGVTYASKLSRDDGRIDWSGSADLIGRQVRALVPWPGVGFEADGERVKVLDVSVQMTDKSGVPGEIISDDGTIACGSGAIRLEKVQRPGRPPVRGADYLNGRRLVPGDMIA